LLLNAANIWAVNDSVCVRRFSIANGLPSNNVYAVTRDEYGYIWFNTDNGVAKYNGYNFRVFTTADGLPSNDVWKLYADRRGRLWVSTHSNKIGYIKDDKYKVVINAKDKIIHPGWINSDERNVYFLYGTSGHLKLAIVDPNDSVRVMSFEVPGKKNLFNTITFDQTSIMSDKDSVIYIRDLRKDVNKVDTQKIGFSFWNFQDAFGPGPSYYYHRFIDINSSFDCIGIADKDLKSVKAKYFTDFGGEKGELIYTYYKEKDKDSLTILTNKAIYRFDSAFAWRRMPFSAIVGKGFQISYYYVDDWGNEWFAMPGYGVLCKFHLPNFFVPDNALSMLFNTTLIGTLNNGNTYWIDKKNNIPYQLNPEEKISRILAPPDEIPMKIDDKSDSDFYLHTNLASYVYNLKRNVMVPLVDYLSIDTVKRFLIPAEPILSTNASLSGLAHVFASIRGIMSIGAHKWLLFNSWSVKVMELQGHMMIFKGLDSDRASKMYFDSVDHLVFFTDQNKISIYSISSGRYTPIDPDVLSFLGINSIHALTGDRYSNIYVLDNDKITLFNVMSRRSMELKCNFNLSNAAIFVYKNYLFVVGKFGLAYAEINGTLQVGTFHIAASMSSYNRVRDLVINSVGTIYISTDKGIFDFSVDKLINSRLIDPRHDELFALNLGQPFQKRIYGGDTINLDQGINNISLNVVNVLSDGNIQYSYKIDGYSDWQQTAAGDILTGALKADHYYKVTCRVQDNAWVSNEYDFYVYRMPYWWQRSSWILVFWISGVLLFATAILIAVLVTRRVVARANDKKRALTELELRAIYAQINPHFIFNTLSATLYFINRKQFDDAYVHVNKFSKLIRGYLKSAQERYVTLGEELEMLKNYVELQKARFEEKFDYSIEVDNKLPVNNMKIPSLLLQPLVENAINHGLFHRKVGGKLSLRFLQGVTSDELICIIDDNGVGRERAREIKAASGVQYESYGTKLTKQLIDVFAEFEKIGITLEYIDKQLPETGTIVKLTIKNIKYVA
jgi:hypothetical protein